MPDSALVYVTQDCDDGAQISRLRTIGQVVSISKVVTAELAMLTGVWVPEALMTNYWLA